MARVETSDFEPKQQLLAEYVERVIYWEEKVEIVGSITVPKPRGRRNERESNVPH